VIKVGEIDPESPDAPVAAHYGDPMREQRTLATAVGLVDRSHRGVLAVPGEERLSWLHNLTTQHLSGLRAGQGTETLVLSPHGHVEHHAVVAEDGTTTWLDVEPDSAAELLTFLEKMRFLTRVEPRDATADWALLSLVGPRLDDALAVFGIAGVGRGAEAGGGMMAEPDVVPVPGPKFAASAVPPRPTTLYEVRELPAGGRVSGAGGNSGWVRRMPLGADLLVPRSTVDAVVARLEGAGVPACGVWAYEAMRVAARIPRQGFETDHRTIPAEVGWNAPAVHLDKGCYRGQETVARVHNLGRPPRRLVLLHLDGVTTDQPPAAGTAVTHDGRQVGFVGTAVRHFELGMIALALIKRNVPDDARLFVGESAAAIDPD
jgi:tRNA-modifying protein YgfZ